MASSPTASATTRRRAPGASPSTRCSHIDPFGTILLPALLFVASGFLFGYAKPVPVNFGRLRQPRRDMVLVALAGPAMNVVLAIISALLVLRHRVGAGERGAMGDSQSRPLASAQRDPLRLQHAPVAAARRRPGRGRPPAALLAVPLARVEPYGMLILMLLFVVSYARRAVVGFNLLGLADRGAGRCTDPGRAASDGASRLRGVEFGP